MLSFIIIGFNVEHTIKRCLDSVFSFIGTNNIPNHEVIFVDSNSSDLTVKIASDYDISIFRIEGDVNAAIGRNVGARHARGDVLFFLDGDMELLSDIDSFIFDKRVGLRYPFIRGKHRHVYYDSELRYTHTVCETLGDKPVYTRVTGGLMIIQKALWERVNGMDERLIRNQDVDLGLRLSKIGMPALQMNHYFVNHHTRSYEESSRLTYFLTSKALFAPGILLRKHIFYKYYLIRYSRFAIYVFMLIAAFGFLLIHFKVSLFLITTYFIIQLLRAIKSGGNIQRVIRSFSFKFLYNIYGMIGFLFYYPGKSAYKVVKIKVANS